MDYKEKYEQVLKRARIGLHDCNLLPCDDMTRKAAITTIYNLFPELAEGEEEKIRKDIISYLRNEKIVKRYISDIEIDKWIAWLEKQGNNPVNIDVESMVSSYEQRLESQGGTKYAPLVNMCLTSFRHGVENVLEELNLKKLEKQGKTLDPDKVIGWLVANICDYDYYVKLFKKDFGI